LVAINEYHTFGPSLTNELRVGFNRFAQTVSAGNFSYPNLDSFPNLVLNDLNTLQIGPDGTHRKGPNQNTYSAAEAITWTKSAHTLKLVLKDASSSPANLHDNGRAANYEYVHALSFFQVRPGLLAERSNGTRYSMGPGSALLVRE